MNGIVWTFCIFSQWLFSAKEMCKFVWGRHFAIHSTIWSIIVSNFFTDDRDQFVNSLINYFAPWPFLYTANFNKKLSSSLNTIIVCYCLPNSDVSITSINIAGTIEELYVPASKKWILLQKMNFLLAVHTFTPNLCTPFKLTKKMLDIS